MTLKLKVCGMRERENIIEVASLRPDFIGFIFYSQSPRFVGEDFTMPTISDSINKVGVFVNETSEQIIKKSDQYKLDFVQLHGNETVRQCQELSNKGLKIIKSFSVDIEFDFKTVAAYSDYVAYFLFDAKGKYFGGNATTFDWALLKKYTNQVPFFLSGGISSENVSAAQEFDLDIYGIDVNSGVELSPAMKDVNKIKELKRVMNSMKI